jgi:two-component system LytT family sensor kinase
MTRVQRHVLFWLAYVLFKTYLNVSDNPAVPLSDYLQIILGQLTFLGIKIPLVYFCFYVIDRYVEMRWSLTITVLILMSTIIVGSIGISVCNHLIVLPLILHVQSNASVFATASLLYHSFTLMFVAGVATSIRLFRRQQQSRVREIELQKEKTEAELKYLKGQINPHFLFNTLNNIYSLALKGSDQTSEAILRLSKMMRFVLYEAGSSYIMLKDELALIQDYIKLEKLRYTNRLEIKYSEEVDDPTQQIAPLLLIHFVENAFKHGVSETRAESFVNIDIRLARKSLTLAVSNSKGIMEQDNRKSIGMGNITQQLSILYPNHKLQIKEDDAEYSVNLSISFE